MAVAISASAMPGATVASVACCTLPSPWKAVMMPHTVPNRPTYGLVEPMVASVDEALLEPVDLLATAPRASRGGAVQQLRAGDARPASAQAREFAEARVEDVRHAGRRPPSSDLYSAARSPPDQNCASKRSAACRALGQQLALAEDDGPGDHRGADQQHHDQLHDEARVQHQVEDGMFADHRVHPVRLRTAQACRRRARCAGGFRPKCR